MNKVEEEVLFIYSQMQIEHDKSIDSSLGKKFKCGEVYTGNSNKPYSKIIKEKNKSQMLALYPDMKIVHKGKLSKTTYTKVQSSVS